jgi:hypothetical protein
MFAFVLRATARVGRRAVSVPRAARDRDRTASTPSASGPARGTVFHPLGTVRLVTPAEAAAEMSNAEARQQGASGA